jgi:thioredoxin reductase
MATVIIILAAVHGLAAACFLLLARKSSVLVDEEGRPIPEAEGQSVRELTYRIAPLAPENSL